jgi:hypothetical protein
MPDAVRSDNRLVRLIGVGRGLLSELEVDIVLDRLLDTARDLTRARRGEGDVERLSMLHPLAKRVAS